MALWACPADGERRSHEEDDNDAIPNVYVCNTTDLKRSAKIEEGYSAVVVDPGASQEFISSMNQEFCKRKDAGQHVLLRDQVTIVTIVTSIANDSETVFYASCVKKVQEPRQAPGAQRAHRHRRDRAVRHHQHEQPPGTSGALWPSPTPSRRRRG